jgi:hypothetical protein
MSKFLLNLFLQIVIQKRNFPHFRPHRPSSQPAHLAFRPSRGPFFLFNWPSPPSPLGLGLSAGPAHPLDPADRTSVAPYLLATSFMGKRLPSRCLCPSSCLANRWAPPVITFLWRRCLVELPWMSCPPSRPLSLWLTITTPLSRL